MTTTLAASNSSSCVLTSVSSMASAPQQLLRHNLRVSGDAKHDNTFHPRGTRSNRPQQLSSRWIRREDMEVSSRKLHQTKNQRPSIVRRPCQIQLNHDQENVVTQRCSKKREDETAASTVIPSRDAVEVAQHPFSHVKVAERWREIQGSTQWEGLLDPLDGVLRSEMIRYGEFAQAAYDTFDNDLNSKYRGSCRYNRRNLLEKVKLEDRGYEVTHYIYSTASERLLQMYPKPQVTDDEKWSKDSNWIGFVAVAESPREIARLGRRDILLVWRGTVTDSEWMENFQNVFIPKGLDPHREEKNKNLKSYRLRVEDTFLDIYQTKNSNSRYNKQSAQEQAIAAVKELLEKFKHERDLSITITGHSMGGALATLCAYDLAESGINRRSSSRSLDPLTNLNSKDHQRNEEEVPITVYSFAAPRVGNNAFRDRAMELGVKVLRVVNVNDLIPYTPGLIFNEQLEFLHPRNFSRSNNPFVKLLNQFLELLPITFAHVGVELDLDDSDSTFLKKGPLDRMNVHDLEVYLHLLDGFVAKNAPFAPSGSREIALVNKRSSFLDPQYGIPPFWWQEHNKGLVKDETAGRWVVPEREEEDIPQRI